MRVLAIDYGEKRIGVAVGDPETRVATPLAPFLRRSHRQALAEIRRLIAEFDVGKVIVGYPLYLDGSPSSTTKQVDGFVDFLRRRLTLPVETADERLSSFAAEQLIVEQGRDPRRRKRFLDSLAAQVILESHFSGNR